MWNLETLQKIAVKKGWVLNPDNDIVTKVLEGLLKNHERHGRYYCPCRIIGKNPDPKTFQSIICPCITAEDDIAMDGTCHCELFCKESS